MPVDWTAIITEGFKQLPAIIGAVATLAIALGTLVNTVMAWRNANTLKQATDKIDENTKLTETTRKEVNGRTTELVEATKVGAKAEGIAEGIEKGIALAAAKPPEAIVVEAVKVVAQTVEVAREGA